jgi:8-oxo-dGTP pyrophosphatase MutT (NUDIX family)
MDELRWKQAAGPQVVYALEPYPDTVVKSMFLAGPTPRGSGKSWRKDAIDYLKAIGYNGHVFVPEPRDGAWAEDYTNQVDWEEDGLNRADVIVFYVPRDLTGETYGVPMPALTTNDEWGNWKESGKVVWGSPDWAQKVRYQRYYGDKFKVPLANTLEDTLQNAVSRLGDGALRSGGRAQVPLCIWNKPEFQGWLHAQEEAGNRLDGCRVIWTFWVGENRDNLFSWALHVDMHVSQENRQKANEFVIFRRDIAAVVLYAPLSAASRNERVNLMETGVVLVKEFRSPARNVSGFVTEIPGGGIENGDAAMTAIKEVREEIGVDIPPEKLVEIGSRQLAATLSAHTGSVFAVQLSQAGMADLLERRGQRGGEESNADSEERTYLDIRTVAEMMESDDIDWATLGMVWAALEGPNA